MRNLNEKRKVDKDQIKKVVINIFVVCCLFIAFVIAAYFTAQFKKMDPKDSILLRFPATAYLGTMMAFTTISFIISLPLAHILSQKNKPKKLWLEIITKILGFVFAASAVIAIVSASYMLATVPDKVFQTLGNNNPYQTAYPNPYEKFTGSAINTKNLINCVIGFNALGLIFSFATTHLFIKKRYTTPILHEQKSL